MIAVIAKRKEVAESAAKMLHVFDEAVCLGVGDPIMGHKLSGMILVEWQPGDGETPPQRAAGTDWFDRVRAKLPPYHSHCIYIASWDLVPV